MAANLVWVTPHAEQLLAKIARVSNPKNESNPSFAGLIKYMIKHQHHSPFEMVAACVEIHTTRDIARQILRHRSFSFQEFCVAGNTEISFDLPRGVGGKRRVLYKKTIAALYASQQSGKKLPTFARVFDEKNREFKNAKILEVFQTGIKPTFRVSLFNGKVIECTKEHKFLTPSGFVPLEDAIGLQLIGSKAVMTKPDTPIGCNGVPAYTDKAWLSEAKRVSIENGTGLVGISEAAGVTTHTIRKWLKKHKLQFTRLEVASYSPIWNKGKYGYSRPHHKQETIEKMRKAARRGADSNLWRGGADRRERLKIADWCLANRSDFLRKADYKCAVCSSSKNLELHHVETVASRPDLAYEASNIQVLCRVCHRKHHGTSGEAKVWREKSVGNTLTVKWSRVESIEYIGEQMTYDLEIDHESHNYVGNGIVVHNSQRYADAGELGAYVEREARLQDYTNRQSSLECNDKGTALWWDRACHKVAMVTTDLYKEALQAGIAKEQARALLPEGLTPSRLYMQGTLRSWMHYIKLRTGPETQAEHRDIAWEVLDALSAVFPTTFEAFFGESK